MGVAHFGCSSQHRRDFTFAAGMSQTCYAVHQANRMAARRFGLKFPRQQTSLAVVTG
jgi:hypothetical protein